MNKREFRYIPARELRVAKSEDGKQTITGYAAIFDSLSEDLGGWREQIKPGAFTKCLSGNPDVVFLRDHQPTLLMGRTTSGTLRVTEDQTGLRFECDLPDTQLAADTVAAVERGDLSGCSFGFYCQEQAWNENGTVRSVIEADVFDVSVVTYPAYSATSVSLRSLFPDGEVKPPAPEHRDDGCQCDCPECQAGDCDNCSNEECDDPECDCQAMRNLRLRVEIAKRV